MNPLEQLLQMILTARQWPLPQEQRVRARLRLWRALRESEEPVLREYLQWPRGRGLVVDNLAEKIAAAFGDLLYSEAPRARAANDADQELLADLTAPWWAGLPEAVAVGVTEGQVWWRLSHAEGAPHLALTWHSRLDVVPLEFAGHPRAVAFVSRLNDADPRKRNDTVWRHLEVHGPGEVRNLLFRGTASALGQPVDLGRRPETANLRDTWQTGVSDLLCGVVRPRGGRSIYRGTWQRLLALSEAVTIGRENMRLTAKRRIILPANARPKVQPIHSAEVPAGAIGRGVMDPDGVQQLPAAAKPVAGFDQGEDVIYEDPIAAEEGTAARPQVLEYSFDASALTDWLRSETEFCCVRSDIVPQFIGSGDFGSAESGTALKVRLLPTVNGAEECSSSLPPIVWGCT